MTLKQYIPTSIDWTPESVQTALDLQQRPIYVFDYKYFVKFTHHKQQVKRLLKGSAGVYGWIHKQTGKVYVGSSKDYSIFPRMPLICT